MPGLPHHDPKEPLTSQLSRYFDNKQIRAIQRNRQGGSSKQDVQVQVDWVRDMTIDRKGKGKEQVMMVDLVDWENDIVFDSRYVLPMQPPANADPLSDPSSLAMRTSAVEDLARPRNQALLDGSWLGDIVWDSLAQPQDVDEVDEIIRSKYPYAPL